MAGDQDLNGRRARDPSDGVAAAPRSGLDPDDLWSWLYWYTRWRFAVPLFLVPLGYLVHRILGTIYDVPALVMISLCTLPMTAASLALLHRWKADTRGNAVRLERLVSAMVLWDSAWTAAALRYAGGPIGPFWPFPYLPTIIAASVVPGLGPLVLHGISTIGVTAALAYNGGVAEIVPAVALGTMFVAFSSILSAAVSNRLTSQRAHRREIDHLRAEKALVEAVSHRREEILSVVSHELASPLTTLRGYVRLLRESLGRDRSSTPLIERVDRQVTRLTSLADDLLAMASTQAGALHLQGVPLELIAVLKESLEGARLQFPEAELGLTGEASVQGVWDRDRLDQLFSNLISNAMKFAGAKSKVVIDVRRSGANKVHVTVTDDGPGISADALARIFEPFQRYSTERGGLGLGLAIARSMAELHGGEIWAESLTPRGAAFHVALPTDNKPSGSYLTIDSGPEQPAEERRADGA